MNEYSISYENDFPFILYTSTETATNARTPVISRTDYQVCTVEYVRTGAGFLEINGHSFSVMQDGLYFLTPGSTHSYWPDRENPWYKLFFVVGGPMMEELLKAYNLDQVYYIPACPSLRKYFEEMSTVNNNTVTSNQQASLIFHQFVQDAAHIVYGIKETIPAELEKLKLALDDAIETNFRLEEFTDTLRLSEAHLIRMFRNYFGVTPYEYLMNRKMECARRLLQYSTLSVKEIAAKLNFSDQYYFSNYFKRRNGSSPKEFRSKSLKK